MEAAEKIPKKLYVYLDTTRGHHHRHGGKDVRHRGAGDRVRHACERRVRRGADADGIGKSAAGPRFSLAPRRTIFYNVAIESNNGGWHDVRKQ